jgi:hypothetical protein
MSEKASKRYKEIESKIEKTLNPSITLIITMPEGVDKEAFLKLQNDPKLIETIKKQIKKQLKKETSH